MWLLGEDKKNCRTNICPLPPLVTSDTNKQNWKGNRACLLFWEAGKKISSDKCAALEAEFRSALAEPARHNKVTSSGKDQSSACRKRMTRSDAAGVVKSETRLAEASVEEKYDKQEKRADAGYALRRLVYNLKDYVNYEEMKTQASMY